MRVERYDTEGFHDELFDAAGQPRPEAQLLLDTLGTLEEGQLQRCQRAAERLLVQLGITFNVYGEAYRVSARPHFLGGWGLWDVRVGCPRRCVSAPSGW